MAQQALQQDVFNSSSSITTISQFSASLLKNFQAMLALCFSEGFSIILVRALYISGNEHPFCSSVVGF